MFTYYFRKTKTFFENSGITTNDIVIAVPSYFSNVERQGTLDLPRVGNQQLLLLPSVAPSDTYYSFRLRALIKL
jgi:hypothetical protein